MINKFIPTYYQKDIFALPLKKLKKLGFQYILCDLDNTLAAWDEPTPSILVKSLVNQCEQLGLTFVIVSNNKEKRVRHFADVLQIQCLAQARKPFPSRLLKFLKEKGYAKDKVMIIGDQLLTDIRLANRLKIASIFVDRLVGYDHWPTKINRVLEARIKKILIKRQLLKPLEE
jgi:HAD superfamily phosphatase (TIGR01668 family)